MKKLSLGVMKLTTQKLSVAMSALAMACSKKAGCLSFYTQELYFFSLFFFPKADSLIHFCSHIPSVPGMQ